jgi:hypothetical protein
MFAAVMGGSSTTVTNQNPFRVQFDANQSGTAGYVVLRLNATHSAVGSGPKLLQTWEFAGIQRSIVNNSGSIGIGITGSVPLSASLHISGASNSNLLWAQSPSLSSILFVTGSGRVGIGTNNPSQLLSVVDGGNSKLLIGTNVSIQTSALDSWIYLFSDPAGSKYIRIDAAQTSISPPRYAPVVPAKEIYGNTADDYALGTPDYWMEILLNGSVVLIPCYSPG